MLFISHRGNLFGAKKNKENSPETILKAMSFGYSVEVDVWFIDGKFYLGHDEPKYSIEESFLKNNKLWCHAKNIFALEKMLKNKNIVCFWHQEDDFALTSNGYIWTYIGKQLTCNSICVMPENANYSKEDIKKAYGICSDFIARYREEL